MLRSRGCSRIVLGALGDSNFLRVDKFPPLITECFLFSDFLLPQVDISDCLRTGRVWYDTMFLLSAFRQASDSPWQL
jgi:hypothetical protein